MWNRNRCKKSKTDRCTESRTVVWLTDNLDRCKTDFIQVGHKGFSRIFKPSFSSQPSFPLFSQHTVLKTHQLSITSESPVWGPAWDAASRKYCFQINNIKNCEEIEMRKKERNAVTRTDGSGKRFSHFQGNLLGIVRR